MRRASSSLSSSMRRPSHALWGGRGASMSVSFAVDQTAPVAGVRFEHMDRPGPLDWAAAIRRRFGFRLLQQLNVIAVRHGLKLMETDPARMHRFLAYRRRLH